MKRYNDEDRLIFDQQQASQEMMTKELRYYVQDILVKPSRIVVHDLTVRIDGENKGEFIPLKEPMNNIIDLQQALNNENLCNKANELTNSAKDSVSVSKQQVEHMVAALNKINELSQKILGILNMINY